jgi:hypothetical protein
VQTIVLIHGSCSFAGTVPAPILERFLPSVRGWFLLPDWQFLLLYCHGSSLLTGTAPTPLLGVNLADLIDRLLLLY